jgi:hypothetical protein
LDRGPVPGPPRDLPPAGNPPISTGVYGLNSLILPGDDDFY